MLGVVVDRHVLVRKRVVQRVAKEFLETGNCLDRHRVPRSTDLTWIIGNLPLTIERLGGAGFRDAAAVFRQLRAPRLAADTAQC